MTEQSIHLYHTIHTARTFPVSSTRTKSVHTYCRSANSYFRPILHKLHMYFFTRVFFIFMSMQLQMTQHAYNFIYLQLLHTGKSVFSFLMIF